MATQPTNAHKDNTTEEAGIPSPSAISAETDEDTLERIRSRAYEIWETEGSVHGHDEDHWHQAEHEIMNEDEHIEGDDVPNLGAVREAARQHTDAFIVASDLEDAEEREATPGVREQP